MDTTGWHPASVPETVLSALVKDGTYTNIYFGKNLETIPTAPFTNAWWYRREFDVPRQSAAENATLTFEGINYRANVWLNGEQLATAGQTFGAFRIFNFDVAAPFEDRQKRSRRAGFSAGARGFHHGFCGLESQTTRP